MSILSDMKKRQTSRRLTAFIVAVVFVVSSFFVPSGIYAEETEPAAGEEAIAEAAAAEPGTQEAVADLENLIVVKDEAGNNAELEDLDENKYDGFIYKLKQDVTKKEIEKMENSIEELEGNSAGGEITEITESELYAADSVESIAEVADADMIECIEPDYYVELLGTNDYYYDRTAQDGLAYNWFLETIKAPYVWEKGEFGKGTITAVLDSGVMTSHPDFEGTSFVSPYNALDDTDDITDVNGHGTGMAGIIAAAYNNGKGMTGIMPQTKIMPVKVVDGITPGKYSYIIKGIRHAVSNGADVISMSLGDTPYSDLFEIACDEAASEGVILVAASGNTYGYAVVYPASFNSVVSVSSSEPDGAASDFASYSEYVEAAAPGRGIMMPTQKDTEPIYATMTGTSAATPQVAAMAAMVKSMAKSMGKTMDLAKFRTLLKTTCIDKGAPGRDDFYGYGIIDLSRAYQYMKGEYGTFSASLSCTAYVFNGEKKTPAVTVKKAGKILPKTAYKVTYPAGRKAVGTYKVTVKGQGLYTGTIVLQFKITPPLVKKLRKPCRCKKKLKVKWYAMSDAQIAKYKSAITGYQVRVSKNSKFKKAKYVKVKGVSKTSVKVKGLKRKTTYYMQYRAYKTVGSKTYYSKWSSTKKTKTK